MGGHGSARDPAHIKALQALRASRHRKNRTTVDVDKFSHGRPRHRIGSNRLQRGRRTRQGPDGGFARHT
jgi:hypothetical protein